MNLGSVILVVFLVLKLSGLVSWSWWIVLSPLWAPVGIYIVMKLLS